MFSKEKKKPISMVSIITPAYNAEKFIEETIASVISQTFSNWELLIINDGSTDKTQEIVERICKADQRIELFSNLEPKGPAIARNIAIKKARGEYIAFLDADDIWKPHKLETQIAVLSNSKSAVCFSSYELINEQGKHLNKMVQALTTVTYNKQLKCNYIGNLTGMYNCLKVGKVYMPEIPKRQDWVMWLEAIKKGGPAVGIPESLAFYRVRKNSISSKKTGLLKHNFNVYKKVLDYNWLKSIWFMLIFLIEYFFVKSRQVKNYKPN